MRASPVEGVPVLGRADPVREVSVPGLPARTTAHRQRRRPPWKASQVRLFQALSTMPALTLVAAVLLVPTAVTLYFSFTNWDGTNADWIGLDNYRSLAGNVAMRQVLVNSFLFLTPVPVSLFVSLTCAVLIHERVPGWAFFRIAFLIPSVLSPVVVGELFAAMFSPTGIANYPLRLLHREPILWLGSPWSARAIIMMALVWAGFGFGTMILLAAMSTIDPAIYDAARMDGASWWQQLRHITVPLIAESLRFLAITNVIFTFTGLFGYVFVITGGGPGFSTTTIDVYTFLTTFQSGNFGYGAALAMVLFVIVMAISLVQFKLFRRQESQQGV